MLDQRLQSTIDEIVENNFVAQKEFLLEMVATDSQNRFTPDTSDPCEPVERGMAKLISAKLNSFGLETELKGVTKERQNVLCTIGTQRQRRSLLFSGHMDTVMPAGRQIRDPLEGYVRGDRMYGLGVLDMKASLSAYVFVAKLFEEIGLKMRGKLMLAFVVDEEPGACSKLGTWHLLHQGLRARAAVLAEPGTKIGIGHRGGYRFKVTTKGEAVHTGLSAWQNKKEGKNAILEMQRVIKQLQQCGIPYKNARAFPNKRPVFTFPTLIKGGSSINMVPDVCEAYGDVRLMPGNSDVQVKMCIEDKLGDLADLDYTLEDLLYVPSVEIEEREEVVQSMVESTKLLGKRNVEVGGIGPWNDGWMFIKKDIPTIVQVPLMGNGAHTKGEWVSLESLKELTKLLAYTAINFLGIKD